MIDYRLVYIGIVHIPPLRLLCPGLDAPLRVNSWTRWFGNGTLKKPVQGTVGSDGYFAPTPFNIDVQFSYHALTPK